MLVYDDQVMLFVEGQVGMGDIEGDYVVDLDIVVFGNFQVGVLVYYVGYFLVCWGGLWLGILVWVEVCDWGWQVGIESGIVFVQGDDGFVGFGDGLYVGLQLQCWLQLVVYVVCYWIVYLDL